MKSEWKNTVTEMDGLLLEPQDVGNYNFGYIGRAMGYSNEFLQLGAGYNQLTHHGLSTIQNCFTPSFCDDPRDAYFIYLGALKYDNDNK